MINADQVQTVKPLAVNLNRAAAMPLETLFWKPIPAWKRAVDVVGSLVALILCAPIMILLALIIKSVSRGPILFRQERLGYGARPFSCLKFRTMHQNCDVGLHREHAKQFICGDKPAEKLDGRDPRLLPFARIMRSSGLDELPQLINVLRGDMSLIGPRPCLDYEAECFQHWQWRRFDVRPGITGLWQVSGKNRTSFNEMMRLDIRYAEGCGFFNDVHIALKTVPVIARLVFDSVRPAVREQGSGAAGESCELRSRPARSLAGFLWSLLLVPMLVGFGCRTYETARECDAFGVSTLPAGEAPLVLVPGDQIEVRFFFNPELNDTMEIRPDGMITLQFLGDVFAAGKTPGALRDELQEAYRDQLKEPEVAVIVRSLFQRRVYVGGAVREPGMIPMPGPMDVLQAIMEAGGIDTWSGDASNVVVIRHQDGKRMGCRLDYTEILRRGDGEVFMLQAMDIVYVSRTPIANLNQWIEQYVNRVLPRLGVSFGPDGQFFFSR